MLGLSFSLIIFAPLSVLIFSLWCPWTIDLESLGLAVGLRLILSLSLHTRL